jgi:hypothetical protein
MLRPSGRHGWTLLLLAGFALPATRSFGQTPATQTPSSPSTSAVAVNPSHKAKAHISKLAPVVEVPQAPPPPPTLEQQPPAPPQVSFQNGQLTIASQNATLAQVLRSVQLQTGASVEMPPGAGSERVVARLGPGTPKDVLAALLNGSKFNYVILGEANQSGGVQRVILLSKTTSSGASSGASPAVTTAQNNLQGPAQPQAVQPPEEENQQADQDSDNPNQADPAQTGGRGVEVPLPDSNNPAPGQVAPGGRTQEQMLQDLQRIQQQQQQLQQQLNPANQQVTPFPGQAAPVPPPQ